MYRYGILTSGDHAHTAVRKGFWQDVYKAWCTLNLYKLQNLSQLKDQIIWYNSNLLIGKLPVVNKEVIYQGFLRLGQMFYGNDRIMPFQIICEKSGNTVSFMQYCGIVDCVKKEWGNLLNNSHDDLEEVLEDPIIRILEVIKVASYSCGKINGERVMITMMAKYWEQQINNTLSEADMIQHSQNIYKVTNDPKYRSFQYRLLMVTNIYPKHSRIIPNEECSLCNEKAKTAEHLLWFCPVTQIF